MPPAADLAPAAPSAFAVPELAPWAPAAPDAALLPPLEPAAGVAWGAAAAAAGFALSPPCVVAGPRTDRATNASAVMAAARAAGGAHVLSSPDDSSV